MSLLTHHKTTKIKKEVEEETLDLTTESLDKLTNTQLLTLSEIALKEVAEREKEK